MPQSRGFVLFVVLAIAAIIGALCLATLGYATVDHSLQTAQDAREQAYYCCKSGVSFLASHPLTAVPVVNDTPTLQVGPHGQCAFSLASASGVITVTGSVFDSSGRVVAMRRLAVPPDNLDHAYEVQ